MATAAATAATGLTRRLSDTAAAVTAAAVTAAAVTVARRLGAVTFAIAVARRLGAVTFAIAVAVTRRLGAVTFSIAFAVARVMFARLRRLCLPMVAPGAVWMFAGGRTVVMSVGPGPGFGPRLSLAVAAVAWRAAVVMAAVAALTGLARSLAWSSGRRRGTRDYDEARCENASRSGNACPRRHEVTPPSRPMTTHTNLTTLETLTSNLRNA